MVLKKTLDELKQAFRPILDEYRVEMIDVTLKRQGRALALRLLVDKAGGINIDECASINRRIGDMIEAASIINERYVLEVSSPGLDRPLKERRDFERAKGEDADIWLLAAPEGKVFLSGRIKEAGEKGVVIKNRAGEDIHVPYGSINKAKLNIRQ